MVRKDASRNQVGVQDIIDWSLAAYKCPRLIAFVDSLPKSGTGKIQWRTLQDQQTAGPPAPC